ncbi:MAG: arylsulfatase [Kofleriaceae bacterium]|nr:arylsulfatase [Kofleriaceae bacterium]
MVQDRRPNILLVLLDDAGFMDFGAYGSDTATPRIDGLGQSGAMFTRYYTHPLCGPTRASLMTGQDNHVVGAGTLGEVLTPEMERLPAYSMTWADHQKTIASRLKAAGYQTFVTGKWGVGRVGVNLPHRFGFDRSYVLDATGSDNYGAKPYVPVYKEVKWFEDGKRISLPADFYSSRNIVDKMIQYVDGADPEKPFFGYLAFQAIHVPVQVPREYVDKYDGVFDRGWDVMRAERLQKAIELGLVPRGTRLSPPAYNHRKWNDLSTDEQKYWARAMQVSAGMMEAADHHLGRLLDHLKAKGILDNTIVIVASDNGPDYNTVGKTAKGALLHIERAWMLVEGWNVDRDNLGQRESLAAIGPEWATVSAAPFHLFKFNATEGGLRVPMVVSGPGVEKLGFVDSRARVTDIAPTLLDVAGVAYQPSEFDGRSLMPLLRREKQAVYGEEESFAFETSGTAALFRGNWKITRTLQPYGDDAWHLFDISVDPGETTDVQAQHPKLFQDMVSEYQAYATRVGVYEMPPGESARKQLTINSLKKILKNYWHLVLAMLLGAFAVLFGAYRGARFAYRRLKKA